MIARVAPGGIGCGNVGHLDPRSDAGLVLVQPGQGLSSDPRLLRLVPVAILSSEIVPIVPLCFELDLDHGLARRCKARTVVEQPHHQARHLLLADGNGLVQDDGVKRWLVGKGLSDPIADHDQRSKSRPVCVALPNLGIDKPPAEHTKDGAMAVRSRDHGRGPVGGSISQAHTHRAILLHQDFVHRSPVGDLPAQLPVPLFDGPDKLEAAAFDEAQLPIRKQSQQHKHEINRHLGQE